MTAQPIRLSRAFIYPIKSLRGVPAESLTIRNGRVVGDRLWILVDAAGRFMHQRDFPQMAAIDVRVISDGVEVQKAGLRPLRVHTTPPTGRIVEHVRLWRRAAPVLSVGVEADDWFTSALGLSCRLFQFADAAVGIDVPDTERDASLQDATPFHLTSESSLDDLSRRVGYAVPMIRFRPNITIAGALPYAEDEWKSIRVGTHTFHWVRACTRCLMTTTDHMTGVRPDREPLRTLATYRRHGSHVVFGHYLTCESRSGSLNAGDEVHPVA